MPTPQNVSAAGSRSHGRRSLGIRVLSGGFWMLGGRALQAISGLLGSMLLARMLTPADLGTYYILTSITLLGSTLVQFGTHQSVVKLVAGSMAQGDEAEVRRSLRAVLVIVAGASAVVAGGYQAGAGRWLADHVFNSANVALLAGLTAVWIVLRAGQMLLSKIFRGFHDLHRAAMYEGAYTQLQTVIMLAILWLVVGVATLEQAVQVTLAALSITLLGGAWLVWRRHLSRLAPAHGVSLGPVLRLSSPLFVSSVSLLTLGEMHLWILGAMSTSDQVAIYGASYRLVMLVSLPLTLVTNVIPPMVAELFTRQRRDELERLLRSTASMVALPALLMLLLMLVFSGTLLGLVYGDYFRAGAPVLAIMAIGQAINVWTGSPGVLLSMSDQQGALMRTSVGSGLIALIITLLLVRDYGAIGVAVGYASGLALQNIAMSWLAWRRLGIRTYAGPGQFRDAWFWLRGEQAQRASRGGLHRAIERILRPLENLFCAAARLRIVECLGGPVAPLFTRVNRCGCARGVYFRTTVAPAGSSPAGAREIFSSWLPGMSAARALVYLPNMALPAGQDEAAAALQDEFAFLNAQLARGYHIALMTLPAPAQNGALSAIGEGGSAMAGPADLAKPGGETVQQCNERLRHWAAQHGALLIDLAGAGAGQAAVAAHAEEDPVPVQVADSDTLTRRLCRLLDTSEFRDWLQTGKPETGAAG